MTTDMKRLCQILDATTVLLRKGEVVSEKMVGGVRVTTIDAMPPVSAVMPEMKIIDCVLCAVAVHPLTAQAVRDELIDLLDQWPVRGELKTGPSYITVGARIGDQGYAFRLFALGEVLDLWTVITPKVLDPYITSERADELAGMGLVLIAKRNAPTTQGADH